MRMSRLFSTLVALVLFAPFFSLSLIGQSSAHAESKAPLKLGSIRDPEDQPVEKKADDVKTLFADQEIPELPTTIGWELTIAKKSYGVSQNLRTTSDLITVLSKSIELLCLRDLMRTLTYYPPPTNPACLKALTMMKQIDAENPLVICAEQGFDAPDCAAAFETQETTPSIPNEITSEFLKVHADQSEYVQFQDDLTVKLQNERAQKGLANLRKLADQAKGNYNASMSSGNKDGKAAEFKARYEYLLGQYLQLSCVQYRIVVFPKEVLSTVRRNDPSYQASGSRRGNSLEELLAKGPFSEKVVAEKQKKITNRFRLISQNCESNLIAVNNELATLAAIPCQRFGIASPACIQARKVSEQANARGPRRIDANDGLEKF